MTFTSYHRITKKNSYKSGRVFYNLAILSKNDVFLPKQKYVICHFVAYDDENTVPKPIVTGTVPQRLIITEG